MSERVIVTGPPCRECGRELRWIETDSGGQAATRPALEDCPICLVTEEKEEG